MLRKTGIMLALVALLGGTAYAEDPTLHQVFEAAQSGRLDEAQRMMDKVLQDHPNSGKAHFVEAEILAKAGRTGSAANELATAERLSPGLPFAKPEAVSELKTALSHPVQARRGFPWGMFFLGIGAIFLIYFIFRSMAARSRPATYIPAGGGGMPGSPGYGGYGPGYGPAGGGMGSGILSGLATGAALGAGMVAGEEIAHHLMDGNSSSGTPVSDSWDTGNVGGQDFGVADNSSWDDGGGFFADNGGNDWS